MTFQVSAWHHDEGWNANTTIFLRDTWGGSVWSWHIVHHTLLKITHPHNLRSDIFAQTHIITTYPPEWNVGQAFARLSPDLHVPEGL